MGADKLTELPATIESGTTVVYYKSPSDYPTADGYTFTLYLAGASVDSFAASVVDSEYKVTISATDSAALTAGTYDWTERVSLAGAVYTVASGKVTVTPDVASATAGSLQSHAETALALIEAALEGRLPSDMESYQIAGRAIVKIKIADLQRLRYQYKAEVWREKNQGRFARPVYVYMGTGE